MIEVSLWLEGVIHTAGFRCRSGMDTRKPYPIDVSDEEWSVLFDESAD